MSRRARLALLAVLAAGAALRLLQLADDGIFWPDEIYQSLEPAHRRAFGYALLPWEYVTGARSWLWPMLLAPLERLGAWLGGDRPRAYLTLVRLVMMSASLAAAWGAHRLALRLRASEWAATVGAALVAFLAPLVFFAPRATSENVSAVAVTFALLLLADEDPAPLPVAGAASLLGFVTVLRVQNVILCLAAVGWLMARRRLRAAGWATVVLLAWALADGVFDRVTWGGFWRSSRAYLHANLAGYSGIFGREPASYYLVVLPRAAGAAGVALLLLALVGAWRARGIFALICAYLLVHSLIGYKQLRLMLVLLPALCALAAVGVDALARRSRPLGVALGAVAVALALWSGLGVRRLTFGDLGANYLTGERAFDHDGALNRALLEAHDRADLCGIALPNERVLTGGATFLHRRVPIYGVDDAPPATAHHFNYRITSGRDGTATLTPLGFDVCVPDPAYRWRAN